MDLLANLINGISLGSVYAIIALGYTMVYGIAKMLNFAHGDIIMVGGYICFCAMSYLGLNPIVAVLLSIAGVLLCSAYPTLMPTTGQMPGIKAFVAAVLGGIGSIPGAMIGGILLGVIEIFAKAYINAQLADAIVFAVLIVVLLIKPAGLLGKEIHEKV